MSNVPDVTEDEDASELLLGEDFNEARCLSNGEVLQYLEQTRKFNEQNDKPFTDVFQDTYSYVKRFRYDHKPHCIDMAVYMATTNRYAVGKIHVVCVFFVRTYPGDGLPRRGSVGWNE
jgi:Asp-tRNA(Asn)/Glu-tRNA(Gln) amidotransferase C subunit